MKSPKFTSYTLKGEAESRIKQEFDALYKNKLDALSIYNEAPKINTMAEGEPFLAQSGGMWYIYIKVRGAYQRVQLTAV